MLEQAIALIDQYDMTPAGSLVLCAVSGGADSMCLLHFLLELSKSRGFSVAAAHYNHRLRGEESLRDADFVAHWCRERGVSLVTGEGDVAAQAARQGRGIEETARAMRYDFLARTAQELGADCIATAHNADDNLETLLLHLVRGSGLRGLTGIPPRRENIVRPLLTTPRAEIEEYLARHGIEHIEDSSNADTSFARNRLRHEVIPVLRALNPKLTESVTATIATLRADNDYLNARAMERTSKALWAEDDLVIDTKEIATAPAAIAPRVVRQLLEQLGDGKIQAGAVHLNAVVDLCRGSDPSARLNLPGGIVVQRLYGELLFTTEQESLPPFEPVPLNLNGETPLPDDLPWRIVCRPVDQDSDSPKNQHTFRLNCDMIQGVALVRPRQPGDTIALPSREGSKTLKKLMIEHKVPRRIRERIPVLADEAGVLAVAGFGPNRNYLAQPGQRAIEVTITSKMTGEEQTSC